MPIFFFRFLQYRQEQALSQYFVTHSVSSFHHQALYIWVGRDAPTDVIQSLFNVPNFNSIPENLVSIPLPFLRLLL